MFSITNNLVLEKNHSTNHAVIMLADKIAKTLGPGKIAISVYLDTKKAFDVISHPILLNLKKLYVLGIRGNLFNWTKNYLTNRSQFVSYNNVNSETKFVTHGVPQGSI